MENDKEYSIVVCASAIALMQEVNICLSKGYIPLGGAFIIPESPVKWCQTLVRKLN